MTNYNERLDEVLSRLSSESFDAAFNNPDDYMVVLLRSEAKAKQAITSLIKELVAGARVDELKHLIVDGGIWYQDMTRQFPQKITLNERIKELEA